MITLRNSSLPSRRICKISRLPGYAVGFARRISAAVVATLLLLSLQTARAASATWNMDPDSGDWNDAANWSAGGPPNGSSDTAFFSVSSQKSLFLSANTEVDGITFNPGASPFTTTASPMFSLTLSGAGIMNISGTTQNFVADASGNSGEIAFTNDATAGSLTKFTINGGAVSGAIGGFMHFSGASTAGNGAFTINQGVVSDAHGGHMRFDDTSTAGNGTFTINGRTLFDSEISFHGNSSAGNGTFTINGGDVFFDDTSNAANAILTANGSAVSGSGGGSIIFFKICSAGSATLIANGGTNGGVGGLISFDDSSTSEAARVELFGNGTLSVASRLSPGVPTIGSIEGDGIVALGSRADALHVGSNNLNTTFSGVMHDGFRDGGGGTGAGITKIGLGVLTLSGANTYTGPTIVNAGKLIVDGSITSAVTVNGGTLGGSGTTSAITANSGGTLSPGNTAGILNVAGNVMLTLGSTYLVDLNGAAVGTEYDQLNVTGLVSLGNATLSLNLGFTPAADTMFTIINNDLSDLVTGMLDGLPEGATFSADGQMFSITYHGGDGNDVVLTSIVPEPGTWALLSAGAAALMVFGRRSRSRA